MRLLVPEIIKNIFEKIKDENKIKNNIEFNRIDVSTYQGRVNCYNVKEEGIDFVIIRVPFGVYWYKYAKNL